jgi:hypothetical protein
LAVIEKPSYRSQEKHHYRTGEKHHYRTGEKHHYRERAKHPYRTPVKTSYLSQGGESSYEDICRLTGERYRTSHGLCTKASGTVEGPDVHGDSALIRPLLVPELVPSRIRYISMLAAAFCDYGIMGQEFLL